MEVSIHSKTAHIRDISSGGSPTTDPHNLIHNKWDLSMSELKTCLTDLLYVEETGISNSGFNLPHEKNHDISNSESEKCLNKCSTFPPSHEPKLSGDAFVGEKGKIEEAITAKVSEVNDTSKPFNQSNSRSLVSALKGSREKASPKLSVTWAPDVYDPIPTSVSHVPSDKNQRYRSGKKYGKYKQKKSSKGSKSKDKKQVRKSTGGSSKPKQAFYVDNGGVLGVTHDPFCGSSFMKGMHFPVAEAT